MITTNIVQLIMGQRGVLMSMRNVERIRKCMELLMNWKRCRLCWWPMWVRKHWSSNQNKREPTS
jgi:hypothetical protein